MIDIYGIIAVGSALVIGIIPIMSKKLRGRDFLVSYVEPKYGEKETKYKKTTPGEDATKHLEPARDSVLKIVTYNFPKQEYEDATWIERLREWNKDDVEIRIIGGPNVEARRSVQELIRDHVIEVKLLKKPLTYHINIATSPHQLWIEKYHKSGDAEDCTFTPMPDEEIWNEANSYFDNLWDNGQTLEGN
jgi:hypothetical protein